MILSIKGNRDGLNRPRQRLFATILVLAFVLPACKYDITKFDPPTWTANIIGPLAFSSMRLEDVNELKGLEYDKKISLAGIIPPFDTIPAVSIPDLGHFDIQFFDVFYYVKADSLNLTVTMENNLPVDIDSGGTFVFINKQSRDTVYSFTLHQTVPKSLSFSQNVVLSDKIIEENIELWLTGFSTLEENNASTTTDASIKVTVRLDFIDIIEASVKKDSSIIISDTADFNLQGEDLNVVSIEGLFNIYIKNGFPFSGEIEAYFLTEGSGELLDSLFSDSLLHEAKVQIPELVFSNGAYIVKEPLETKLDSIPMDDARIKKIIDSKKVYFRLTLKSSDKQPLIADNRFPLEAQIVGDLKVEIDN